MSAENVVVGPDSRKHDLVNGAKHSNVGNDVDWETWELVQNWCQCYI